MKLLGAVLVATLSTSVAVAQNLDRDAMLQLATDQGVCGAEQVPVEAWYEPAGSTTIKVSCGPATGFVPAVGAVGLGGGAAAAAAGLALIGAAGGGGGSAPPSTN